MPLTLAWIWIGSSSFEPNCIRKVCKTPWALLFKCDFEGYQRQTVSVHDWHISGFAFTFWKPRLQGVIIIVRRYKQKCLSHSSRNVYLYLVLYFRHILILLTSMCMSNDEIQATIKVEITWGLCSDVLMKEIIWSERLSECRTPRRSPPTFTGQEKSSGRDNDVNAVNDCRAWRVWVSVVWGERKSLSVPGGRLGLFLFLLFSVPFSRGHSESSGPLELLNCRGSLFVAGSKGSGFRPIEGKNG